MKSLLISLMAFLCVLGVNATPTGSGTQEDPYVIADGDNYVVNAPVYASFTAPGDGTLTLSYNLMKDPAFTVVGGDVMPFTWGMGAPSTSTLEVKSGETYVIYNANTIDWETTITVSFTAASGDALKILSSEPEQGSKVEKISWDNQVKVTLNKKVKYVHCEFHGDEGIMHQYYTSEAEEGEDVIMVGPEKIVKDDRVLDNAWYMYEGNTYTMHY